MSNVFCDYYYFCSALTKKPGKTVKNDLCPIKISPPASGEAGGHRGYRLITVRSD